MTSISSPTGARVRRSNPGTATSVILGRSSKPDLIPQCRRRCKHPRRVGLPLSRGASGAWLLFIAATVSFLALGRRVGVSLPRWAQLVPPYAIGSVAMFWVIQRVMAF